MAAPLKQNTNNHEKIVSIDQNQKPKFQEYRVVNTEAAKFKELVFFGRIVSFAICTVLSSLALLTINVTPILAFPFGMLLGSLITTTLSYLIDLLKR